MMAAVDLPATIEAVTEQLPGWDHTVPAAISSMSDHVWTHPTEREEVKLSHWLTGTEWLVQVEYWRGGKQKSHLVVDSVDEMRMWLVAVGAAVGTLSLAGAR